MLCEYFGIPKKGWWGVVGLKCYGGLLAIDLASLSTVSLPSNPECAQIFWRVIRVLLVGEASDYDLYN